MFHQPQLHRRGGQGLSCGISFAQRSSNGSISSALAGGRRTLDTFDRQQQIGAAARLVSAISSSVTHPKR
jgi:hypothetical protein